MSIRLHIERLVLYGVPLEAAQGPAVQAAVQDELARLLGEPGTGAAFPQSAALAHVHGAELRLPPAPGPGLLGREIGAAVHRSLAP